ncbi:MAG: hypothetical protein LBG95_00700 [Treponema sp.]|jgi:vacuolar-type H+-ATPase subunit H|nr:hypothetical protein [Treponema sp.]
MDNNEILGHLLKIESEAAALVEDAQEEADKRLLEADRQNHSAYEERYRKENERLENELSAKKDEARRRYQAELESYIAEISSVPVDNKRFSALLDRLVTEEA